LAVAGWPILLFTQMNGWPRATIRYVNTYSYGSTHKKLIRMSDSFRFVSHQPQQAESG